MENKQAICDQFLGALQLARGGEHLKEITYHENMEMITLTFHHGTAKHTKHINVAGDSGIAMMFDILDSLL